MAETINTTPISGAPATASASGDTAVRTPAGGKAVRLSYICLSADAGNGAAVLAKVLLGTTEIYRVSLAPGAMFAHSLAAMRRFRQGAADDVLTVNLDGNQSVHISHDSEEV